MRCDVSVCKEDDMAHHAIEMLKKDHKKVKQLLEELAESSERATKKRAELLEKIEKELKIHTTLEEEIFYPAFREADGKEHDRMYYEAKEEHRAVEKLVLPDLLKTEPGSETFSGRAKVLKELIEHHVEEEEQDMFPAAEKTMEESLLDELAEKMAARRNELS